MASSVRPFVLALSVLLGGFDVAGCDTHEALRGEPRELTRVSVGDAEVTLSVDVLDHHAALQVHHSGGGRGSLPDGIQRLPSTSHWPIPVVEVRRGGRVIELEEAHVRGAEFREGAALDEAGAVAAARAAVATTCVDGERVAYRITGPGYDSGFHGLYVRGGLAIHQRLRGAVADCAAALAALPPLDALFTSQLEAHDHGACARVALSRDANAGFECSLEWPESTSREYHRELAAGVAAGAAHAPDWEAVIFTCLEAADATRPGCLAYLGSTSTPERRLAFLAPRAEACSLAADTATGPACLAPATLVTETARLGDAALCATVFSSVERLAESPEHQREAGIYASDLARCVPEERHERLARGVFLRDDGSVDERIFARCTPTPDRACRSLSRLGAAYVATTCDAAAVTESRALLAATTMRAGNASVDAALFVLARCAPDEVRAWLEAHIDAPLPRGDELAYFGLPR